MSYRTLIGTPYDKMNCWDAVRAYYQNVKGVQLSHYFDGEVPNREDIRCLINSNVGDFERVDKPQKDDIVIFSIRGIESHIGIYLSQDLFFHSSKTTGVVVDRFSRWKNLVVGYYRHKERAHD